MRHRVPHLYFQAFELIDTNKDLVLSWEEIYSVDMMTFVRSFPELFDDLLPYDDREEGAGYEPEMWRDEL